MLFLKLAFPKKIQNYKINYLNELLMNEIDFYEDEQLCDCYSAIVLEGDRVNLNLKQ